MLKQEEIRYMWLFVMFDLPVVDKDDRKEATKFRQFLLKDGYYMIQYSVYMRVCRGEDGVKKHLARLKKILPSHGSVRTLRVTERQYKMMGTLVGVPKKIEKKVSEQLLLF